MSMIWPAAKQKYILSTNKHNNQKLNSKGDCKQNKSSTKENLRQ